MQILLQIQVIQKSVFRKGETMLLVVNLLALQESTTQSNLSLNQISRRDDNFTQRSTAGMINLWTYCVSAFS